MDQLGLRAETKGGPAVLRIEASIRRAIGLEPRITDRERMGTVYWIDVDLQEPGQVLDSSIFQSDPRKITRLEMRACRAAAG